MLTGEHAFRAATPADTISAILHKDPPEIATGSGPVPPGLDRVVRRCLEKDPDERFQTARDLAFALENQSSVSGIRPVDAPNRPFRWARATAGLVLLAGAAAAGFVWGVRRPPRLPELKQLTFRRGMILDARFTPDGNTVVYSALFDGHAAETYSMRLDRPEAQRLDLPPSQLMGVSSSGE